MKKPVQIGTDKRPRLNLHVWQENRRILKRVCEDDIPLNTAINIAIGLLDKHYLQAKRLAKPSKGG